MFFFLSIWPYLCILKTKYIVSRNFQTLLAEKHRNLYSNCMIWNNTKRKLMFIFRKQSVASTLGHLDSTWTRGVGERDVVYSDVAGVTRPNDRL